MLIRDAGWTALAATLFGLCCWHAIWGSWPAREPASPSVVAFDQGSRLAPGGASTTPSE